MSDAPIPLRYDTTVTNVFAGTVSIPLEPSTTVPTGGFITFGSTLAIHDGAPVPAQLAIYHDGRRIGHYQLSDGHYAPVESGGRRFHGVTDTNQEH